MKRLSFIFVLCVLVPFLMGVSPFVRTDGEPQVQGPLRVYEPIYNFKDGFDQTVTTKTKADLTLYVRTTGNDSNDCLTSGNACLTIQETVDRIPKYVSHNVTIDIGAGSFAAFNVIGFHFSDYSASFTIQGTLGNPTLTTGTVSGTADGGNIRQLVDSGQNWTVNELRGMLVLIGSVHKIVRNNDATTINFAGAYGATCNGKAYEIFEQKTVIDSGTGTSGYGRIEINGCVGVTGLKLSKLKIDANAGGGCLMGVYVFFGQVGARLNDVYVLGGTYTVWASDIGGSISLSMTNVFVTGGSSYGVYVERHAILRKVDDCLFYGNAVGLRISAGHVDFDEIYADSNTSHGLLFNEGVWVDIDYAGIDGNGGYGIYLDENVGGNRFAFTTLNASGTLTVANNTLGGIMARNHTVVALTDCDGAGNGNHGLELQTGSYATITTDTGITGATGDATINGGTTTLTWAVHFNDNGDTAINSSNLTVIERKD